MSGTLMDVELCGGPLDGAEGATRRNDAGYDVYLFQAECPVTGRRVLAYVFRGRSVGDGKRWALDFLYAVARQPKALPPWKRKGGAA
jgi:hypothetical protein